MAESPIVPSAAPAARIRALLLLSAGLQLLVLLGLGGKRLLMLRRGQTVLVRVQPVDPRDLFRGDYVTLSYDFSRLGNVLDAPEEVHEGAEVFVALAPDADRRHWRGDGFSVTRPGEGLYLRGTVGQYGRVDYGIESFFVQEGQGKKYEEAERSRRLYAEIAVSPDGRAALKSLRIE